MEGSVRLFLEECDALQVMVLSPLGTGLVLMTTVGSPSDQRVRYLWWLHLSVSHRISRRLSKDYLAGIPPPLRISPGH